MKKNISIILILLTGLMSYAQEDSKIGIKAGFNYEMGEIALKDIPDASLDLLKNLKAGHAWHLGVYYRSFIDDIMYIQPELIYSNSSQMFTIGGADGKSYNEEFSNDLLDFNLLLGAELLDFVRAYGGLTATFNLKSEQEYMDAKSAFKTIRMGYQLGVGLDIARLSFDMAYLSSFNSDNGSINVRDFEIPLSQNRSQIQLSIGISL